MKQTKEFHDMFNEVITEATIGDSRTSGAVSNWKYRTRTKGHPTARGSNPPGSLTVGNTSGHAKEDGFIDLPTQSKEETEAPKRYPFPMGTVETMFSDGYSSIQNILSMIKQSSNHPSLTKETKEELSLIQNQLEKTIEYLQKVAKRVTQISI